MLLSSDFASEGDLLDRVMEKGIVVEVWDRLELFWHRHDRHEEFRFPLSGSLLKAETRRSALVISGTLNPLNKIPYH